MYYQNPIKVSLLSGVFDFFRHCYYDDNNIKNVAYTISAVCRIEKRNFAMCYLILSRNTQISATHFQFSLPLPQSCTIARLSHVKSTGQHFILNDRKQKNNNKEIRHQKWSFLQHEQKKDILCCVHQMHYERR